MLKNIDLSFNDILDLITELEQSPTLGRSLGHNLYKIRLAVKSKGHGKSGGARVRITYVKIVSDKIYLASIYDKSEKEDITNKELKRILKELGTLS